MMIIHFASVNVSTQPPLVLSRLQCKCVCLRCISVSHHNVKQYLANTHAVVLQHRNDQTKCADQYESVNYCYTVLQIKAARSAQLCANTATFALILPRAAISLILSVTAYYTVAYNQWLLNSTLYPFVFVCFSICGSVFLARRWIILLSRSIGCAKTFMSGLPRPAACTLLRSLSLSLATCRGQCLGWVVCLGMVGK